jgi:pimeloyl-ACP methyl ester carboxylesterase
MKRMRGKSMLWNTQSRQVVVNGETMNYIEFGKGEKALVILPGLGDGISPVHGKLQAIAFALGYKQFSKTFRVYLFSRKNCLNEGYSTRDMAKDQAEAMKTLGISKASVMGVSQGGMIAQYLAIDYPNLVNKLVLAVTLSKQNELIQEVVTGWIEMAKQKDYQSLIIDTAEKSYSEKYLKRYRLIYPLLGCLGKPKDFNRFLIQAESCIVHNSYPELDKIVCPTLVLGGENDRIVSSNSSLELTEKIKGSELFLYKGLGHATYEEATDFNSRVLNFLMRQI